MNARLEALSPYVWWGSIFVLCGGGFLYSASHPARRPTAAETTARNFSGDWDFKDGTLSFDSKSWEATESDAGGKEIGRLKWRVDGDGAIVDFRTGSVEYHLATTEHVTVAFPGDLKNAKAVDCLYQVNPEDDSSSNN